MLPDPEYATGAGNMRRTPIIRLMSGVFPSAVSRGVGAIVVDPSQRVGDRSRPKILVKSGERLTPRCADRDSAPSIRGVARVSGIQATLLHGSPRLVLARVTQAVLKMVLVALFLAGTAFSSTTSSQFRLEREIISSAVADASPRAFGAAVGERDNPEMTESPPSEVYRGWSHQAQYITFDRNEVGTGP